MRKTFFFVFIIYITIFSVTVQAFAKETQNYDVVIVGAGSGGCAAAIQAARMGMSVALIEQSDYIGGQMTGAAVSSMDDKTMTRTGIYLEFITKIKDYYSTRNTNVNICYWGSDTISFEPRVGQEVLREMLTDAGVKNIILKTVPISVKISENTIVSTIFSVEGKNVPFSAKIFIDATECGDFIPLTGARYRAGNSISPEIDKNSIIQNITYPAIVKRYKEGIPPELIVKEKPPRYEEYLPKFRMTIRKEGSSWPGKYPFNIDVHNAYRAIPDTSNKEHIDGGVAETWSNITKSTINWANDYPGDDSGLPGMSVEFLESSNYRIQASRQAMAKTLAFLYYMQTELGMSDWSVDNSQNYGGWFSNDWKNWNDLPERYAPILSHFPPFPYVRESRRLVGLKTMTVDDVMRNKKLRRTLKNVSDSVALGEYPIDIHGQNKDIYLETTLGETIEKIPNDWAGDGGLFQIPLGVFIPEKIDGLLAAEKNISVSRVVNGSTRLQPVTMLTGQAAGAIAAVAIKQKVQPRSLLPFDVQDALWREKSQLSLFTFKDVPYYSSYWPGVEAAMLYEYMAPVSETIFGAYDGMHWIEVKDAFRKSCGITEFPQTNPEEKVYIDKFAEWLRELYKADLKRYENVIDNLVGEKILNKGKLASTILNIKRSKPLAKKKK